MKLFAKEYKNPMTIEQLNKKYKKGKISFEEWERGRLVNFSYLLYAFMESRENDLEKLKEQLKEFQDNGKKTELQLAFEIWKNDKASEEDKLNALIDISKYRDLNEMDSGHYYTLTLMNDFCVGAAAMILNTLQDEYRRKFGHSDESHLYGRPFMVIFKDEMIYREGIYKYVKDTEKNEKIAVERAKEAAPLKTQKLHDFMFIYVKLLLESAERYVQEHGLESVNEVLADFDKFQKLDCFTDDMLFVNPDGTLAERDIHLFNRFNAQFDLDSVPSVSEYKKML